MIFSGAVEDGRQALFIPFPFCQDALMQVADINLEFFHVRFLLACLMRGEAPHLFACAVDGRIVGMLFLALKTALFYSGLEIKYIATLRGRRSDDEEPPPRGVGRFLVAGTWLLWKTAYCAGPGRSFWIPKSAPAGFTSTTASCPRDPTGMCSRHAQPRPAARRS